MANPVEMASPKTHVAEQLKGIPGYGDLFAKAFPGESDPITLANAQKAIAVFEATLITPNGPFDRFLRGEQDALSPTQKAGLAAFMDKGCSACHNGINVGGGMYAPFGVVEKPGAEFLPPADKGRFMVSKTPSDEYVFKVPTLRNIALTAPYFHTGKAWDLRQAVAVMGTSQLNFTLRFSNRATSTLILARSGGCQQLDNLLDGFVGAVVCGFELALWAVFWVWRVVEAAVGEWSAQTFVEK